ncbi:unnamed protein product [Amoebophrya sp. A25]|nr:unnamed protein product [Amoebophrya sp. A25]|eukprot:GSA25T00007975001.1
MLFRIITFLGFYFCGVFEFFVSSLSFFWKNETFFE